KTASTIKNAGTSKQSYLKGKTNSEQIFLNNNTASKQVFLNSNSTSSQVFNNTSSSHVNLSEILFVIWRESVEALLVVGVVYNWLKQLESGRRSGFVFLWLGVIIGLLCSFLLSFLLINISHFLSPHFASLFQASMTLLAATMIIYMVKWMRENGRTLKTSMHQSLEKKSSHRLRNISILTVVSIAFAREASEASIFIYALSIGNNHISSITMLSLLLFGILLALGTIYLLQLGNKIFSWRFFFKCTEILLLLLGGGLLLNCVDSLIVSGFLTPLYKNVWNTSFLISEGGIISPILSSFTGYRATPSLMDIIAYSLYWLVIYFLLRAKKVSTCNIN
ncbi:MAG: FTR1 family protein, partial [Gammaproteobacteria bacterium]|nr:FTR1 family protein [Gammaproteobacteria bacterium]